VSFHLKLAGIGACQERVRDLLGGGEGTRASCPRRFASWLD